MMSSNEDERKGKEAVVMQSMEDMLGRDKETPDEGARIEDKKSE